jgi:hypothetical protein
VHIGILEEYDSSEWASPTFAIAKKNGAMRIISDFRKLNSLLKSHAFQIPNVGDMIRSMENSPTRHAASIQQSGSHP